MFFSDKDNVETVECLVDTLSIGGTALHETHLSNLRNSELEQLAELSHDMSEMDTHDLESLSHEEQVEEAVQAEFGTEEIEIETITTEDVVPEPKQKTSIPPLQPLTIAPKPTKNVPIAIKPATTQQVLLLQGGQQVKLVSPQGQEVNLSNFSLGKPVTLKPTIKTISTQRTGLPVIQPKQVIMKKVVTQVPKVALPKAGGENKPGHIMVVQKSDSQVTLLQNQAGVTSNQTKTITLAQAQQMGFLTGAKIVPQVSNSKQTIMLNKAQKTVKIVPQVKTPTKILPAPQGSETTKVAQRIFLKPANTTPLLTSSQLIQVTGAQTIQSGQVHQINIPGKGVQYIKFVTTTSQSGQSSATTTGNITSIAQSNNVTSKLVPLSSLTTSVKTSNIIINDIKKQVKPSVIAPKSVKTMTTTIRPATLNNSGNSSQILMLPASYMTQAQSNTPKVAIPQSTSVKTIINEPLSPELKLESNGMRPRKPCNCTKSQCLKLYCDCFANGEFCFMCNCMNCYNNLEKEEHRNRAIKNCLERNPNAFRPKIGKAKDTGESCVRKHTKGCNCKRSGCLKNYCECYEAKIACSSNCKCVGCRNIEDSMDKKNVKSQINVNVGMRSPQRINTTVSNIIDNPLQFRPKKTTSNKQAFNFITNDVIEATCQCLLTLPESEEALSKNDDEYTKRLIIEEFGRCLMEIIDCSLNNVANKNS